MPVDEGFINGPWVARAMAKKSQGPGIQSAAGLIRYFDAEEKNNIKIPPAFVLILAAVVGVGVILMRAFWEY